MADGDGGSTDDPPGDPRNDSRKLCEVCGVPIDTSEWYPVTTERDADGTLHFHSFCSEACRDSWHDESTD